MSVLAPPAMPLLPPISILNRTGMTVSAHRTPGLLTLTKPVPAAPKSTRRVVQRTAKSVAPPLSSSSNAAIPRPTTPVNIVTSKTGVFATPPATPDTRVVRPRTPSPAPKTATTTMQMTQQPTPNPSPTLANAAPPSTQHSPGRLARNRRAKHKNNPSLVLEMPPVPTLPAPVPVPSRPVAAASTNTHRPTNPVLSRSEPLPAYHNHPQSTRNNNNSRRRDILPLSDWDLPAEQQQAKQQPISPTEAEFNFWADASHEPQTAPLLSGRSKPSSRSRAPAIVATESSHSDSEATVRPVRQHVRSPSLPLDGIFNMSLSDEDDADAKKILYAGPKFNNSPHPKNLPGAAFF